METQHLHVQFGGRFHSPGHRVRYIVQLEIEKNLQAKVPNFLDEFRSLCGEKLKANFHRRDKGRRHFREPHRFFTVAYIQCQNDAIAGG